MYSQFMMHGQKNIKLYTLQKTHYVTITKISKFKDDGR